MSTETFRVPTPDALMKGYFFKKIEASHGLQQWYMPANDSPPRSLLLPVVLIASHHWNRIECRCFLWTSLLHVWADSNYHILSLCLPQGAEGVECLWWDIRTRHILSHLSACLLDAHLRQVYCWGRGFRPFRRPLPCECVIYRVRTPRLTI